MFTLQEPNEYVFVYPLISSTHHMITYAIHMYTHTHTRTSTIVVYAHTRQYSDYHTTIVYNELKNEWNYTSVLLVCLHSMHSDIYFF